MYFIWGFKEGKNGIDLNGARLNHDDEEVLTFNQVTGRGWASKKAIAPDFEFRSISLGYACRVLEVSDEIAQTLIAKYQDIRVKVYTKGADHKGDLINALVYDIGLSDLGDTQGQFSNH